ncbi:TetR/AcrR family transcriptional regulator [Mycolicibacterium mengxianglii]|uniref:TetR/AcrR family transcriptional regulator n=1 Tax=Mycolicibacterium mengxianglii TaxID=2736649 RepID=UPI0018D1DA0D|nr:TetR family transcriptional regulator [Mycolicibacterium mengxianglii]
MRRQPNPEQRRLDLCDAAIQLLADDGAKGVSHLKIDRKSGVPDGTTSFYFRTRSALLQAVGERVSELDLEELQAATGAGSAATGRRPKTGASGLATLVIRSATGDGLVRTKARNELALLASRDPALEAARKRYDERFFSLIRDAVMRLAESDSDAALVDEQAYVVMMFISGVLLAFASGDRTIRTAKQLDLIIGGIVAGVGGKS